MHERSACSRCCCFFLNIYQAIGLLCSCWGNVKNPACLFPPCAMCILRAAYIALPDTFLFIAQISGLMAADCRLIVLMLIGYSVRSFLACLSGHYSNDSTVSKCAFLSALFSNESKTKTESISSLIAVGPVQSWTDLLV